MAFTSSLDAPPYRLQQLIPSVSDNDLPDSGIGSTAGSKSIVTCAQALGSEIYIGCADGTILRYALQAAGPDMPGSYTLLSRQVLPTKRSIEGIVLLPSVSKALILSDHTIYFYVIPSLDPVHYSVIRSIRGVISFAVDERSMRLQLASSEQNQQVEPVEFCVIKRANISIYNLKDKLVLKRDIPNALNIIYGRLSGRLLCAADDNNYNMIDLVAATSVPLLPILQAADEGSTIVKPSVTYVGEEEFMLLSSMGQSTIGAFVIGNGDPVRGTLEWSKYPDSICIDYPHVVATFADGTIEIHSIETQASVQVIPSNASEPRIIVLTYAGFFVPSAPFLEKLRLVSINVDDNPSSLNVNNLSPSSSATPRPPLFSNSNTLLLSSNSVQTLLPSTLISQADALLESNRVDDVMDLADQNQRKLLGNIALENELVDELRCVYQSVGFYCLGQTRFDEAGRHLSTGEVDPRLLVWYFPELRGNLLSEAPNNKVDVYAGVVPYIPRAASINDIVMGNLVKNYAPHIKPDVETATPTAELRRLMRSTARDMLASYLRKYRTRRLLSRSGAQAQTSAVNTVVDTVLAKILAEEEKQTAELYTLIDEPNDIVLSEVTPTFEKNGQYNALCKLYAKIGNEEKLLEIWSKLVDEIWSDEDIKDPVALMVDLLNRSQNRALVRHWGLWLTRKDADLGLKIIISRDMKRVSKADELIMLGKIREANVAASVKYLEYLVLQKRSQDADWHNQLVDVYVGRVIQAIQNEQTAKLWKVKALSYANSQSDVPFLMYFASTTPESEYRDIRIQNALLLYGSSLYDASKILARIHEHRKLLILEMAILYGKLGRHEEAISTLVHDMHDLASAETYCSLGGDLLSARTAWAIGERCGLQRWVSLAVGSAPTLSGSGSALSSASSVSATARGAKSMDEDTRRKLLRLLLREYMSGGESTLGRTTRLLNAQAMNLDVVDVIKLVPPSWPLLSIGSFVARSSRRTLHKQHEGKIIKAISAKQNAEVVEKTWLVLREQGAIIEEEIEDEGNEPTDEAAALGEKVGLHEQGPINVTVITGSTSEPSSVADIQIDERISAAQAGVYDLK